MTNKQETNQSAISEYSFDYERYIAEKLREIDDLDERRFAKQVLLEGLLPIIRQTEAKYRELEKRIYREIRIPGNHYEVVSTVIRRDHYDPMNGTLFPVIPPDMQEKAHQDTLSTEEYFYVGTVFLEANRKTCMEFERAGNFRGTFLCEGEEKEADFRIRKAVRYRRVIEQLYEMFQDNHIPWETVNTAYLDKFFDVYLCKDGLTEGERKQAKNASMEDMDIRFGMYDGLIRKGMIPLWNIESVTFDCLNFMVPCIDGIYYEHEFVLEEDNRENGYLIQGNDEILEIRHEADRIVVRSTQETFEGWNAVRIVQGDTIRSLDYDAPFLTNHKKDTFIRRYAYRSGVNLMTKTDLFRKIMELDIGDYIEAADYEILENGADYPAQEGMNWFVRDELFPVESRKVLLLKFRAKNPGFYLNDSMVWFVVSQIQMEISEYRCVGRIMEEMQDIENQDK